MSALSTETLAALSYRDLQTRCKSYNLSSRGKKQILLDRLTDHIKSQQADGTDGISDAKVRHNTKKNPDEQRRPDTIHAEAEERKTKRLRTGASSFSASGASGGETVVQASSQTSAVPSGATKAQSKNTPSDTGYVGMLLGSTTAGKARGVNKSGKWWKQPQKRSSNRTNKKDRKRLWDQKMKGKAAYKQMKELESEFLARRAEEKQARIEKLIAKRKRKQENELKNAKFQTISNDSKIKRMSKKQLRLVKRMQVNTQTGVAQLVSPWAGRQIKGKFTNRFGRTGR